MSCRVMTKGIGSAMLVHIIKMAQDEGEELYAEFKETDRNRVMYIIYKMMGFIEAERNEGDVLLKYESDTKRDYPSYIKIKNL
jgi:predicted enzyme involved in methoxymalonyl-ACP biosynthesis